MRTSDVIVVDVLSVDVKVIVSPLASVTSNDVPDLIGASNVAVNVTTSVSSA